jgi:ABC-2 type transport system ATP-binding protein
MNEPIIQVRAVTKAFKDVRAVDELNLDIFRGQYTALLGPNGAGKTTLVEMIEDIQQPDRGEIRIFGKTWGEARRNLRGRIGVALQETRFIEKLRVSETFRLFGSYVRATDQRIHEIMLRMKLEEKGSSYVVNLSGGQRQRLALGIALINQPEILLLDEPTTGLDPQVRREIWDILEEMREAGTTLILTTHYMEEAQQLCDRVIIMDHGKILAEGNLDELLSREEGDVIEFVSNKKPSKEKLTQIKGVVRVEIGRDRSKIVVQNMTRVLPQFLAAMKRSGIELRDVECRRATLDDVFVSMTGRRLTE